MSSDELRVDLIKEYEEKNPDATREEKFINTRKILSELFITNFKEQMIKMIDGDGNKIKQHVIYLDKNVLPKQAKQFSNSIDEFLREDQRANCIEV